MQSIEKLKFLDPKQVVSLTKEFGTPIFVYSQEVLEKNADACLAFPNAHGLSVRYAMKANPNQNILRIFRKKGIRIDASSSYEVERALNIGFEGSEIMLTAQEIPANLREIVSHGVFYNACSLRQLETFCELFPGKAVGVRLNPGLGSGATQKTDTGGVTSSFGIWHEYLNRIVEIAAKNENSIVKIHTHIGSGSDPEVWKAVAKFTLELANEFPDCHTVSLGGGYKVARMSDEKTTDLQEIGEVVKVLFDENYRHYHLEIEPGTYLVASAGALVSQVNDIVDTGKKGMRFVKLDTGMDANTRPSLYASRHPLIAVRQDGDLPTETEENVFVGHCCESGDVFTQEMGGNPITRKTGKLSVGDFVVMEGVGAYCSSMSTKNYNSFPETPEVLVDRKGKAHLIRKKQSVEQIMQNEIELKF